MLVRKEATYLKGLEPFYLVLLYFNEFVSFALFFRNKMITDEAKPYSIGYQIVTTIYRFCSPLYTFFCAHNFFVQIIRHGPTT